MGFVFSGLFWGGFVILIGVGIIVNVLFDVKIPIGKIIFAMLFIGIGINILVNGFGPTKGKDVIFNEGKSTYSQDVNEYNIVFGKNSIDFTEQTEVTENKKVELNCVFGDGVIKINEKLPMKVKISSAFAGAQTPDGNTIAFGEYTYTTPSFDKDKPHILLKANVVFGALHFYTGTASEQAPSGK